ncbi:MAG: alpha-L-arabinofuranosidase C-terminal domain-containing protein [Lentilactobacillus diolivorans]|uniref:alpha-L-arabinofuranosidase C-terminal domain-containing protein n=1 Tax=Lentilactobacillus diolivorans TaxID=179838 RepID=UPI0039E9851D
MTLPKLTINPNILTMPLNDLYGIFFEDLNHAADGGLYAEKVRNRSFEFDKADHEDYSATFAWRLSDPSAFKINTEDPLNTKNQHYLETSPKADVTLTNVGYNQGMYLLENSSYDFSFFAKPLNGAADMTLELVNNEGYRVTNPQVIHIESRQWIKYSAQLKVNRTTAAGRLVLTIPAKHHILIDMVSLFPENTFNHRKNYVRADLGESLKALHPKFLRFPGGCLVHDGTLDPDDRESLYRWKNSIGPVEQRPTRRNKWGYNQSLGLGYYEYFQLAEDVNAKPLPVLPGGYDPHHQQKVPIDQLGDWIDDALDLIEFANGATDTKWGAVRAKLGHPKPFHLEYLAIGNEEVGQAFFDRYPYFHKAIKAKYPDVKLINTSGPFASGTEFERGWQSAKENHSDLVDEHYYMAPEWFLANQHRYDSYDPNGPKAFLGEYATKANKWFNAVVEASYMIGLEHNADKVGLACYAPLFCNVDYPNWTPDLIFFNQQEVSPSVNYYVQQLFMKYQGTDNVSYKIADLPENKVTDQKPILGQFGVEGDLADVNFTNIKLTLDGQAQSTSLDSQTVTDRQRVALGAIETSDADLNFDVTKTGGNPKKGAHLYFGQTDSETYYMWILGGWENQDSIIKQRKPGSESDWSQGAWTMAINKTYHCRIRISDRHVTTWIDGKKFNDVEIEKTVIQPLYVNVTFDRHTNQYYLKAVNVTDTPQTISLTTGDFKNGTVYQLTGNPAAENQIGKNNQISIHNQPFTTDQLALPPYSVTALISPIK